MLLVEGIVGIRWLHRCYIIKLGFGLLPVFYFQFNCDFLMPYKGFPRGSAIQNPPTMQETWVRALVRKIPWRRAWQPTPVFLSGESHEQRNLAGYGP